MIIVKRIIVVLMGLVSGMFAWESFQAFHNSSIIENGTSAGIAMGLFSLGIISAAMMLIPRGES